MYKVVWIARYRKGLTKREGSDYWSAHIGEIPMIEGPTRPFKVDWMSRFREGMTRPDGREYWRNIHGPIFKELDIDRYVQNHVIAPQLVGT